MPARNAALIVAALAGITTLAWKSVPGETGQLFPPENADGDGVVWQSVQEFCWGLRHDLSVGAVRSDESRVRDYIVAQALDDLCGEPGSRELSEE